MVDAKSVPLEPTMTKKNVHLLQIVQDALQDLLVVKRARLQEHLVLNVGLVLISLMKEGQSALSV